MGRSLLNDEHKINIARLYKDDGWTVTALAQYYLVSRQTIRRALTEKGIQSKHKQTTIAEDAMVKILRKAGVKDSGQLENILNAPVLNAENINRMVDAMTDEQVVKFLIGLAARRPELIGTDIIT